MIDIPQFVQIRLIQDPSKNDGRTLLPYMGDFFSEPYGRFILQFGVQMQFLPAPYHVFYSIESYLHSLHQNKAIDALTKGSVPTAPPWYGCVVVLKVASIALPNYLDMALPDVDHIKEYFVLCR